MKPLRRRLPRARSSATAVALALAAVALGASPASAAPVLASATVTAPATATVGDVVDVSVVLTGTADVYAYMKSYTPYENVADQDYPAILATTSLNDTRVYYVEPAKWVAALRATAGTTTHRPVLLKTEMVAGHGGVSGRYAGWREVAFANAWVLDQITA